MARTKPPKYAEKGLPPRVSTGGKGPAYLLKRKIDYSNKMKKVLRDARLPPSNKREVRIPKFLPGDTDTSMIDNYIIMKIAQNSKPFVRKSKCNKEMDSKAQLDKKLVYCREKGYDYFQKSSCNKDQLKEGGCRKVYLTRTLRPRSRSKL